jgi:osomolarity two-component system phosphorelay intermediate protein YPD1
VRDSCEKIQNFGSNKDETGVHDEPNDEICLQRLTDRIKQAKEEFRLVERALRQFYPET